ncbi:hypothetical protein [Tautonia plasticadhaerens]|uniref:Uncharacterized protein n=1 Tax=Tautonia plasticadhaerens TaxID=2527974 RepID=A0A518GYX0_9BACT|nr:hypothetical protein [Tautonia plasticadhaerens]QDV33806.1 hypothetical protein ElP_16850 [Tautonia plasticadhaerens]
MSRRLRIAIFALAAALIALELGLRSMRGPRVEVVVENRTGQRVGSLAVGTLGRQIPVSPLVDGGRVELDVLASGSSPLILRYRDDGDLPRSLELPSFEGKRLRGEGLRFVVVLLPDGEVSDYNEDDPSASARFKAFLRKRTPLALPSPF